jgi:transposase
MTTEAHSERSMYMAMDLGNNEWVLRFGDLRQERGVSIPARDQERLWREIDKAKVKFGLPPEALVYACYEAGRDGFWIQRMLKEGGVNCVVVDSSSLEVNRKARRVKTDRIDAHKLLSMLIRYLVQQEKKMWAVLHIPSEEDEMQRRMHRSLGRLKKERTGHLCRIKSLLITMGIRVKGVRKVPLDAVVDWKGRPLPEELRQELAMEYQRLDLVDQQIELIQGQQKVQLKVPENRAQKAAVKLAKLRGLGADSGWQLSHEFFWRDFGNRRQVGAAAGLTGCPYSSGTMSHEQGISKSGNARVRALMVEMAWRWVQFQGGSALSRWFQERFGSGTARMRRVGIVALARKLLVALWRYLKFDEVPQGAILKA